MKFAHVADLHLGKAVSHYSMLEEQRHILHEIFMICVHKRVDAILLAGDIYDRPVPSEEAVCLLNDFLKELQEAKIEIFLIAGNHDSGERLSFAAEFLDTMHIHITGTYEGSLACTDMSDAYGILHVWSLPFIRPLDVRRYCMAKEAEEIHSYTDAVRYVLTHAPIDFSERNILVTHQFVAGGNIDADSSEELTVGGVDHIDPSVFAGFDYVALGHLHRAQSVKEAWIRYSGAPLKYALGEAMHTKSLTLFSIAEKGEYRISTIPLKPRRDMVILRGTFQELTQSEMVEAHKDQYVAITLTNEEDVPDALSILRTEYPFLMQMEYDNERTRHDHVQAQLSAIEERSPLELFADFYALRNEKPMSEAQKDYMQNLIKEVWKENKDETA